MEATRRTAAVSTAPPAETSSHLVFKRIEDLDSELLHEKLRPNLSFRLVRSKFPRKEETNKQTQSSTDQ